ncbi:MAG TPA: hypothetical protein ENI61_00715 [Ignavibacteria bacterium]|nr:hypothetical protein [Ignavibacteria bacterium]
MRLKGCSNCNKEFKQKKLKKIKGRFICVCCYKKDRLKHREFLKEESKNNKIEIKFEKSIKEKNKIKKKWEKEIKKIKDCKLIIKKTKRPRIFNYQKGKISSLGLYITRDEKKVLYFKLMNKGYSIQDANEYIKQISNKMSEFSKELNKSNGKEEDLNMRFKEEFAKLVERS